MRPAPPAAMQTAIAIAIGAASHALIKDATDFNTIPLKTSSSKNPPSIQATTMPAISLAVDSWIARKVPRVGGLWNHRDANLSATGLYASISPSHTSANPIVGNHA